MSEVTPEVKVEEAPKKLTEKEIQEQRNRAKIMKANLKSEVEYVELIARKAKAYFEEAYYAIKYNELMASQRPPAPVDVSEGLESEENQSEDGTEDNRVSE